MRENKQNAKELRLALIGKNIQHSLSPDLYQRYFPDNQYNLQYDLIDIKSETHLPNLDELSKTYHGINITSPYKTSYFGEDNPVNTIDLTRKPFNGILSDELAFESLWESYSFKDLKVKVKVILLGDGVMGKMVSRVLKKLGVDFLWLSRKKGNLDHLKQNKASDNLKTLFINTCSRDFVFEHPLKETDIFWDFNYAFHGHDELKKRCHYIDGESLLEKQAEFAVEFWEF